MSQKPPKDLHRARFLIAAYFKWTPAEIDEIASDEADAFASIAEQALKVG